MRPPRRRCAPRCGPGSPPAGTDRCRCGRGGSVSSTPAGRCRRGRSSGTGGACPPGPTTSCAARSSAVARWRPCPAGLAGPTILEQGPDLARERFLRPLLTGEEVWCQLFSEPGSGSDLAGLTTTRGAATATSGSSTARRCGTPAPTTPTSGMLLARTDWDVPKHQGITYFVLPMNAARRRGPPAAADERPRLVQRGVPHRRPHPEGLGGGRGEPGLDARPWPPSRTSGTSAALGRARFDGHRAKARPSTRPGPRRPRSPRCTRGTRSAPVASTSSSTTPSPRAAARPGRPPGDRPAAVDAPRAASGRPSAPRRPGPSAGRRAPKARSASSRSATSPARRHGSTP